MPNLDLIQMSALYDTGNILHSALDLNELLKHAVELGQRVMRAKRCICFVFEDEAIRSSTSESPELYTTLKPYLESMRTPAPLTHLTGLAADPVWGAFGVGELILAPLKVADSVMGALYVDRAIDAPLWSEGDVNLCEAFAEQVGLAVRNGQRIVING
jgi:GAF domain-containing protein